MEEKDYKKLYEDVVALAKDGLKDGLYLSQSAKAVTEFLFPQLKETEEEKARKGLVRFLINFNNGNYSRPTENEIDSWIKLVDKQAKIIEEYKDILDICACENFDKGFKSGVEHKNEQNPDTQPNKEWSEEDAKRIQRIHDFIWKNRKGDTDEIFQQEQDANWLMTFVPQPKQEWKPSHEQLEALKQKVIGRRDALYELYLDLQKL